MLPSKPQKKRSGLSLLEVLTALAIFMLSVVVISQMVSSASRTAVRSERLSKAAILCESKMAELVTGIEPLQAVSMEQFLTETEPGWFYSVMVEPQTWTAVPLEGQNVPALNTVQVTVLWSAEADRVEYTLTRTMLDPRFRVPAAEAAPTTTSSDAGAAAGPPAGASPSPAPSPSPSPGAGAPQGGRPGQGPGQGGRPGQGQGQGPGPGGRPGTPGGRTP